MISAGAILLILGFFFLGGSAVAAFLWAARDGQFQNLDRAPEVIFDESEPVGTPTDRFPDKAAL